MEPVIFRWIRNMRGSAYCERALASTPNHNVHLEVETHTLTEEETHLTFDELIKRFPKPL